MRTPTSRVAAFMVALLVLIPQATASPSPPEDLACTWDTTSGVATCTWEPPDEGVAQFNYHVWRDSTFDGTTTQLGWSDTPPGTVPDFGYIYFVSASPPGNPNNIGLPAVAAVPTYDCEVVSISTTWDPPYLHAALHEECLGGTKQYWKNVTWVQP